LHEERLRPYAELLDLYRAADLAFDLFTRNPERELAFNTRTVDYLACGLPPLYSDYAELAGPIGRYEAGFVLDPTDAGAIAATIGAALDNPARLALCRRAARQLVDDLLTWDRTVAPLAAWCAKPTRRERATQTVDLAALIPDLVAELAEARAAATRWRGVAEEREQYARHVEAAWRERGEALAASEGQVAAWRDTPWRTALRQTMSRRNDRPE
jgi:hypothetical protein